MKTSDAAPWQGVLIAAEATGQGLSPSFAELAGEGRRLADQRREPLFCLCAGFKLEAAARELACYPVDRLLLFDHRELRFYREDLYAKVWVKALEEMRPAVVLFPGSEESKSLAPVLAARFDSGLTADCTSLAFDDEGNFLQRRPAYGGDIIAEILTLGSKPHFATLLYHSFEGAVKGEYGPLDIRRFGLGENMLPSRIEVAGSERIAEKKKLSGAKIIVAAGQGFRTPRDLEMAEELAGCLGGEVASSRSLVEKGWFPADRQIGLSGNIVRPDVIMTCGISGSAQFMAGMKTSRHIIAVNNDPQAPIFSIAHLPVLGDLYEVLPPLIRKLQKPVMCKAMS